jgi:outer membrane protein assembly factor BamB
MRPGVRAHDARPATARPLAVAVAFTAAMLLAGCSTLSSWIPSIPVPSFGWLTGSKKKPGPLPEFTAAVTPQVAAGGGRQGPAGLRAGRRSAMRSCRGARRHALARFESATGRSAARQRGKSLSAGVGADAMIVVGTDRSKCSPSIPTASRAGRPRSAAGGEPVRRGRGIVAVSSGDGRVYGLSAADGSRKWVYQRVNPPLTVRNYAGGTATRGSCSPACRAESWALDHATGTIGWEGSVATPKGRDGAGTHRRHHQPAGGRERQVCAVAFGRVACFDATRGTCCGRATSSWRV